MKKHNSAAPQPPTHSTAPVDVSRRRTLGALGAFSILGSAGLIGCGGSSSATNSTSSSASSSVSSSTATASSASATSSVDSCTLIPTETEGPYPLTAILSNSAIVRADIAENKSGVPLTLKLKLVNVSSDCSPFTYASIYVWHCDKDGVYSGYSQPGANTVGETFCRGVQDVDENGVATFNTIFPGWYTGRLTHIHFQVFLYNDTSSTATATSQLAFPADITTAVYNSSLYSAHGQNTSVSSFAADNVFSDGITYQLASVTGSVDEGFVATLDVGIAAG